MEYECAVHKQRMVIDRMREHPLLRAWHIWVMPKTSRASLRNICIEQVSLLRTISCVDSYSTCRGERRSVLANLIS
jgi:hypothetical protein